jgi:hypothetical protein
MARPELSVTEIRSPQLSEQNGDRNGFASLETERKTRNSGTQMNGEICGFVSASTARNDEAE